ncbi:hypothetical protein DTO002I6_3481 [Penicillium roqueforti]|nr:hypothetical protein DTO002I6_3481 [Penicillium roqueforti]
MEGRGSAPMKRNRGRCGVCGVRGHRTHDHWRYAQGSANAGQGAPVINIAGSVFGGVAGVGSTTTNLAWGRGRGQNRGGRGGGWRGGRGRGRGALLPRGIAGQPDRLEQLEAALAQQQETIARLQQENAELSRLRLQEGSAEQANEEPTDALSITDGLDAEFEINLDLDSDGEEMK